MIKPKSRSLYALLTADSSQLRLLTAEAQRIGRLRDAVRRQLPPTIASHCFGAELQSGTLVIYMDSAAAAVPVRYQQRDLVDKFSANDLHCTAIKVQILPDPPVPPRPKPAERVLPDSVRQMLENTAAGVEEDSLSRSLRQLARGRTSRQ